MFYEAVMLCLGLVSYYITDMRSIYLEKNKLVTPLSYFKIKPYKIISCFIASLVGFAAAYSAQELTLLTAFAIGSMPDLVVDKVSKNKVESVISKQ